MSWTHIYLVTWAAATLLAAVLTRLAIPIGHWSSMIDKPATEAHKKHSEAVSVLGGSAIFSTWLLLVGGGFYAAIFMAQAWAGPDVLPYVAGMKSVSDKFLVMIAGASALFVIGIIDDISPLKPLNKLIAQAVVCAAVAGAGIRISVFPAHPFAIWAVTTVWLLFIINAINFFDNMDGMAAGVAVVASFLFFLTAALQAHYFIAVLAAATGGAALGFLFFNWPPARIFMGDSGSHVLGYLLGVTAVMSTFYSPETGATPAALLIPVLILALPIFDLFAVVWLRIRRGVPFYKGDNMHISHRFRMMGLGRGTTTVVVHLLGLTIGAGALPLLWLPLRQAFIVLIQAVAMLTIVSILHAVKVKTEKNQS